MATLASQSVTLLDFARRTLPDGSIDREIVEMLSQKGDLLEDIPFSPSNQRTSHVTTIRLDEPTGEFRLYNQGTSNEKSRTAQITEICAQLQARSRVDIRLAQHHADPMAFRASEDIAFINGVRKTIQSALIYGDNGANPATINGLATRFNSLSSDVGGQIIDVGGSGADLTSIYVVCYSDQTVHGVYPQGSMAGLQRTDRGIQTVQDADGKDFEAYVTVWDWDVGLVVRDPRYVVRLANIDVSALVADTAGTSVKLAEHLIRATHLIPDMSMGRTAIYANRTVHAALDIQNYNRPNLLTSQTEPGGRRVSMFRGVPLRTVDALRENETRVV